MHLFLYSYAFSIILLFLYSYSFGILHQVPVLKRQTLSHRASLAFLSNVKSSCFIQSFLVVSSNKSMKQSFHAQGLPNPVQPPKISSNHTPTNNWVAKWPFPQPHGCGKWWPSHWQPPCSLHAASILYINTQWLLIFSVKARIEGTLIISWIIWLFG